MKYRLLFLIALGFMALLLAQVSFASQREDVQSYRQDVFAYRTGFTHNDPPLRPHFGAYFNGSSGRNQHYTGTGGDAATCASGPCIGTWHWWGPVTSTLLIDGTWYWSHGDHRLPAHYKANMLFN